MVWVQFLLCNRSKDVTVVSDSKKVLTSQDKTRPTPRKERRVLSFKATTYAVCPVFSILSAVNGYVMFNKNFERNNTSFQFKPCTAFYKFPKGKKISTLESDLSISKPQVYKSIGLNMLMQSFIRPSIRG